jgi:hypothetical protein
VTDGVSFYGQLLGQTAPARSWIFCHFDPHGEHSTHRRFVQNQEWKLYQNGALYHITQDPDEMHRLTEEEVAALPVDILELKQDFEGVLNRLQ